MDRDLASTIVNARCAAGLSQAELARRAGISPSYLSRIEGATWERGGPWPADGVLRALARALGISSTELVTLRQEARERHRSLLPAGPLARSNGRMPYAVSVGADDVDAAARGVVDRNPPRGTLRSVQVFGLGPDGGHQGAVPEPSYLDSLGCALAVRPDTVLYRVSAAERTCAGRARSADDRLAGGRPPGTATNVRSRFTCTNPLVLDLLVGDHEVLIAFPDRGGHPNLRAGVVVDDPDFVAAVKEWFDEWVWDPPCLDERADAG